MAPGGQKKPAVQLVHFVDPVALQAPAAQQAPAPALLYRPLSHAVHDEASLAANVPAAHCVGALAPGGQALPAAHAVQLLLPALPHRPAAQHSSAPAPEKVPAAQSMQVACPVAFIKVLAGQGLQVAEPGALALVPGVQSVHAALSDLPPKEGLALPAGHRSVVPFTSDTRQYAPGGHCAQHAQAEQPAGVYHPFPLPQVVPQYTSASARGRRASRAAASMPSDSG